MTILNISFMTQRTLETSLLDWLRRETPALFAAVQLYRVVEVAEVEGDLQYAEQALNVALQFEFPTLADARDCASMVMPTVHQRLADDFGEQVMAFSTILETRREL